MEQATRYAWQSWAIVGGWRDGSEAWVRLCPNCGAAEYRHVHYHSRTALDERPDIEGTVLPREERITVTTEN